MPITLNSPLKLQSQTYSRMASCSICTEPFGSIAPTDDTLLNVQAQVVNVPSHQGSIVCSTQCGHLFHLSCITKWLNSGRSVKTCPICKKEICHEELIIIYQDWPTTPINSTQTDNAIQLPPCNHGYQLSELTELRDKLNRTEQLNSSLELQVTVAQSELEPLRNELAKLHGQIQHLCFELDLLRNELNNSHRQIEHLCIELDQKQNEVVNLINQLDNSQHDSRVQKLGMKVAYYKNLATSRGNLGRDGDLGLDRFTKMDMDQRFEQYRKAAKSNSKL